MVSLGDIVSFCDDFLNISSIEDYPLAYNGLQFENSGDIKKTLCEPRFDKKARFSVQRIP